MNVTAIYFSPTDTNRKSVCAIAKTLGGEYKGLDITCKAGKAQFGPDDVAVFGAPVYGGRLFKGIAERLHDVRGENTPCVVTVTYGNRDFDDALLEFCDMLSAQGFVPVAAGAMIGQHTYGSIQVGRPNESDLAEDAALRRMRPLPKRCWKSLKTAITARRRFRAIAPIRTAATAAHSSR